MVHAVGCNEWVVVKHYYNVHKEEEEGEVVAVATCMAAEMQLSRMQPVPVLVSIQTNGAA